MKGPLCVSGSIQELLPAPAILQELLYVPGCMQELLGAPDLLQELVHVPVIGYPMLPVADQS